MINAIMAFVIVAGIFAVLFIIGGILAIVDRKQTRKQHQKALESHIETAQINPHIPRLAPV